MCHLVNPKVAISPPFITHTHQYGIVEPCMSCWVSYIVQEVNRRLNCRMSRRHRLRSIGGTSASATRRACQKTKRRDIIGECSAVGSRPSCIGSTVLVSRYSISTTSLFLSLLKYSHSGKPCSTAATDAHGLGCCLLRSMEILHGYS